MSPPPSSRPSRPSDPDRSIKEAGRAGHSAGYARRTDLFAGKEIGPLLAPWMGHRSNGLRLLARFGRLTTLTPRSSQICVTSPAVHGVHSVAVWSGVGVCPRPRANT